MEDLGKRLDKLAEWLFWARHPLILTGAGISTDSGLRDYRGPDGVWTRQEKGLETPEIDWTTAHPNQGHWAVSEIYRLGKLKFLVSQNVDNLHRRAGIPDECIAELHGNYALMRCPVCEHTAPAENGQVVCNCGVDYISSIIHFGMQLPEKAVADAFSHAARSDLFIVLGSSLVVTPAADLPAESLRAGARLVIVNKGETPYDDEAHLLFSEHITDVLLPLVERLHWLSRKVDIL
ncbi:Sir2 family NAD-dependent protein deacetylase [Chloroflexota bacterium]